MTAHRQEQVKEASLDVGLELGRMHCKLDSRFSSLEVFVRSKERRKYNSVTKFLPGIHEGLGFIPRTTGKTVAEYR